MNVRLSMTTLFALLLAVSACGGGGTTDGTSPAGTDGTGSTGPEIPDSGIYGKVVGMDGAALSGVAVSAKNGASTKTDAKGFFELDVAAQTTVLTFLLADYVPSQKRVVAMDGSAGTVQVTLRKMEAPQPLDNEAGGTVEGTRGARLVAPAGAFVNPAGVAATGSVDVRLTPFDPSDDGEMATVPGDFEATNAGGDTVMLESYGLVDVTVTQNDIELDIAKGTTVTVTIPGPANPTGTPPATIPLWSLDEATATWKEEGTATYDAATNTYSGEIGHLSMWNCDHPVDATCIKGVAKDENGDAIPGAHVTAKGIDYMGTSTANADEKGEWCVAVRQNSKIRVTVMHPAGGGTIREVESGPDPTQIPPNCADPKCKDVGEWVVEMGKVKDTGGNDIDCSKVANPFAGTCVEEMGTLLSCFNPQGKCTIKSGGTIEWENGASFTFGGMDGHGEYKNASGAVCATIDVVVATTCPCPTDYTCVDESCKPGPGAKSATITAGGKSYQMVYDEDEEVAFQCPDGSLVLLDDEKMDIYEACTGTGAGDEASGQTCEYEGGGTLPSSCASDSDCEGGKECCEVTGGTTMCMPKAYCDMICSSDSDCASGSKCCQISGSGICVPGDSCPAQ